MACARKLEPTMSGIGVILNPFSKRYKKDPDKLDHMAFIIGDKASCKPTEDIEDLCRVAEEFKSRDIDVLAISGGDGTIHCTFTTFINVYGEKPLPKITFLRGGTLNTIAATMGVKGSTESLMSNLLIRYHEDKAFETKKLRLIRINQDYGCIFGLGMIYAFMEEYYRNTHLNPFIAGKTVAKTVFSAAFNGRMIQKMFKRFDADVLVGGKKWPFANYSAIFAGSIRQLGFDFNVFYAMLKGQDYFHVYGLSAFPREVLRVLKSFHDGKPPHSQDIVEEPVKSLEIKLAQPMPYTIDGDLLPAIDCFKLELGPEITVLV